MMLNPLVEAQLRRNWQVVTALLVFVLFLVLHLAVFQPAATRYRLALKQAADLGMPLDPSESPHMMPPRVFALLSDNSLPAAEAVQRSNSGSLASSLLEDVTRVTSKAGMEVMATEPGVTAQQAKSIQVKAYLRVSCTYPQFVRFLDELSRSGTLISVERFTLVASNPGRQILDLWVTRLILKQTGTRS
jgi:hypothetical protein